MRMRNWKNTLAQSLCLLLSFGLATGQAANPVESTPELKIAPNVDKRALVNARPDYVKTLSEMLKGIGARQVTCTSGYRSPESQAAACKKICGNPNGCPNLCAPPGRSQHQKTYIATCDLGGMPANGCSLLKKLCDEKFDGKCGVGGYPGGGYHFGVNDYRFSSWNRCAGLPRSKGQYGNDWKSSPDPSPGSAAGSELDASEASEGHEIIWLAAIAAAGAGGYLLYKQLRKK